MVTGLELGGLCDEVENLVATGVVSGIGKKGTEDDGPTHREWPRRPPEVHSRDVSVAQALFARRCSIYGVKRQLLFDEAASDHDLLSSAASITAADSAPKRTSRFGFQSPARALTGFWIR